MAVLAQLLVTIALAVGHPANRIPAGVRTIEIRSPARSVRVTDPARVRRIERWFDAMPAAEPGLYRCPNIRGGTPRVRFAFLTADSSALARASLLDAFSGVSGPCNPVAFRLPGHRVRPLIGGRMLLRVQRLLGVRFG
jgi:hypothetical protein